MAYASFYEIGCSLASIFKNFFSLSGRDWLENPRRTPKASCKVSSIIYEFFIAGYKKFL
jgi:hypothetical protein